MCGCESRDSSAAYAVPACACDASITLIPAGGRLGGVTFDQITPGAPAPRSVFPASRVTWMKPVLVPTQITPAAMGDGASVVIDPPAAGPPTPPPPAAAAAGNGTPAGAAGGPPVVRRRGP